MKTITLNLTLTGQITIDSQTLEHFLSKRPTQSPAQPPLPQNAQTKLAYSTKEAAELLSVTDKTVYRLIERGLLKSSSALRHKRIPKA